MKVERRLHKALATMKRLLPLLLIPLAACGQAGKSPAPTSTASEMRTIENTDVKPGVIDPPAILSDEGGAAPKPHAPIPGTAAPVISEKDEQLRASLPFAPAIAMDPVDGSKISIRADTPTVQTKTRLFYFSSEDHKREFVANPEQFMKGAFSKL
jgi:YHS domain-containing protein